MSLKRLYCPNCAFPILFNNEKAEEKVKCSACKKSFRPKFKSSKAKDHHDSEKDLPAEDSQSEVELEKEETPAEDSANQDALLKSTNRSVIVQRELDYDLILSNTSDSNQEEEFGESSEKPINLKSAWVRLRNLGDNGQTILKGFSCLSAGIFLVNFPYVDYLVVPLALFGALIGLQGYRQTFEITNKRWAVVLMTLGIAFSGFNLFYPRYFRNLPEDTRTGQLPEGYESTVAIGKSVDDLPWLDSKTPAVYRGIKIQVTECSLKQYKPKNFTGFEKKDAVPFMLHLRISVSNDKREPIPYPGIYAKLIKVMDFKGDELPNWVPKSNAPDNNNPKALLEPSENKEFLFYFDPATLTQDQVKIQIPGILFGFPGPVRFEVKAIPKIKT